MSETRTRKSKFEDFKEFWDEIMLAILKQASKSDVHLSENVFFMSGMLAAATEILKAWNQEVTGFTPEMQEQIDKQMKIFMRQQAGNSLDKVLHSFKIKR